MKLKDDATLDHRGEFDELFVDNAFVHIERMNTRGFWIGISLPDGSRIQINTGVAEGRWYFNLQEDGGDWFSVQRPACHRKHAGKRKAGA